MGLMNDPTARLTPEYRWKTLLDEFKRDFPAFDLRLTVMDRDEFAAALQDPAGNSPDVAFLDNGRLRDPLTNAGAVLLMVGESRFAYNGWWTIFRNTKSLATAKAFVLWLSPTWKPPHVHTNAIGPADIAAVQSVSKDVIQRVMSGDTKAVSLLMDPDAGHLDFRSLQTGTPASIDPLMVFGSSRLAFALVSEVVEGDKTYGLTHSVMVLRKLEDRWRVLLIKPGPLPALETLLQTFDGLGLKDGEPKILPKVDLLSPTDHARLVRYPPGELEWSPVAADVAGYVLEWQMGQPGTERWSPREVRVVPPASGNSSISIDGPAGAGQQPHRWRIWAVGRTGIVSTSAWRTIDFQN